MKNLPGRTTSQTCNNFPVNDRNSTSEADTWSSGHWRSESRSLASLAGDNVMVIPAISTSQPITSSFVSQDVTLRVAKRDGSVSRRLSNKRKWSDACDANASKHLMPPSTGEPRPRLRRRHNQTRKRILHPPPAPYPGGTLHTGGSRDGRSAAPAGRTTTWVVAGRPCTVTTASRHVVLTCVCPSADTNRHQKPGELRCPSEGL